MFRSCDHLQVEVSVVFRILVNFVDNGDRFLVMVNVVAVGILTIACCCHSWCGLFWCYRCFWFEAYREFRWLKVSVACCVAKCDSSWCIIPHVFLLV
jgi:hypothetical protein